MREYIRRRAFALLLAPFLLAIARPAPADWYVPLVDSQPQGLDHIQVIMTGSDLFVSPVLFAFCGPDAQGAPSPQAEAWQQTFLTRNPDYAAAEGPSDGYEYLAFAVHVAGNNQVDRPKFHYQAWKNSTLTTSWDVRCVGPNDWDWEVTPGTLLMGDANLDGTVDLQDFGLLKENFGWMGGWRQANFNGDYIVDLQDFGILKAHFGQSTPLSPLAAIPEPASLAAAALASALLLGRRRAIR